MPPNPSPSRPSNNPPPPRHPLLPPQEPNELPPAPSGGGSALPNVLIAVVLLAIVVVAGWKFIGPKSALAGWSSDWESATAEAKKSGRPTVVLFTADWCPPCKDFKVTLSRDDVAKYLRENFSLVVVDLTDRGGPNTRRAAEFGVQGIPTLILYDGQGRERGRTHGMHGDALMHWLSRGGKFW